MYTHTVGYTVLDSEKLPPGIYQDDVVEELGEVVSKAVQEWYDRRGNKFLACEPT